MILILMVEGARAGISFCILSPTPSCPVAPPCTPVSPTECRRRSPPWLPPPSRSRSSLPPRGSTPYGLVAPSWPPCPPSSRCGSPSRSTTSAAHPLSTESASKCFVTHQLYFITLQLIRSNYSCFQSLQIRMFIFKPKG